MSHFRFQGSNDPVSCSIAKMVVLQDLAHLFSNILNIGTSSWMAKNGALEDNRLVGLQRKLSLI